MKPLDDPTNTDQPPSELPDPNERGKDSHRFGLHPLVITLVLVYFFLFISLAVWRDRVGVVEGLFGLVMVKVFIIGVPSWFMWRMGRSRLAGNVTCTLVVCILLGVLGYTMVTAKSKASNQAAAKEFSQEVAVMREQQSELIDRSLAGEDVSAEKEELLDKHMSRIDKLGSESTGHQAQLINILSDLMREIPDLARDYNDSYERFIDAGGIDPSTMKDAQSLKARMAIVEAYAEATEQYATEYAALESNLRAQLKGLGFELKEVILIVREWKKGAMPDLIAQSFQTDRDTIAGYRGIISLLMESFGNWSINGGGIHFEDDKIEQRYMDYLGRIDDAISLQDDIHRQIQQAIDGMQATP